MKKKIFILLPDGIGLRNFAFTNFYKLGIDKGFDTVFWNNTVFNLKELDYKEIKIKKSKLHPLTDFFKSAKIQIGLNNFIKKTNDRVYDTYRFPKKSHSFKSFLINTFIKLLIILYNSKEGIKKISKQINKLERQTTYFKDCIETLKKENPVLVFCTNQRPVKAMAPLLAAKELGIKTATFIFSWDNLPKATMIVETDYYFVWSKFMKEELLFYYPYIDENQIFITGTPQFEPHFDDKLLVKRNDFFEKHGLNGDRKYICFSGDDITTSPDDEKYLSDVAESVKELNSQGKNLGIIFRRCPVDFSDRYDIVLKRYAEIIVPIAPLWERNGNDWNTIMPTVEDLKLQVNIITNSEFVINLASSMVFDFVAFDKPCAYLNYDVKDKKIEKWSAKTIYNFVHFRSMPSSDAVVWINSSEEMSDNILKILENPKQTIEDANKWFNTINIKNPQEASKNIWKAIDKIIS